MKKTQQSAPVITSLGADQEEPRSLSRHADFSKQNMNSCGLQPPGKHQCGFSAVWQKLELMPKLLSTRQKHGLRNLFSQKTRFQYLNIVILSKS